MKKILILACTLFIINQIFAQKAVREKILFDQDWLFAFGHATDGTKDFNMGTGYFSYIAKTGYGDGAASAAFDDRAWRKLDLPHDWVVEVPFNAKGSHSHGYKAVGRNFPEASVGWYRKHFYIEKPDLGKQIFIDFDGVSRDSKVWVNGHYLGNEPSGYQSFSYNISDILNYGADNIIAVRADVTLEEGWYYEGAGIYRHVWLRKTSPVYIPNNGTFVYSVLDEGKTIITVETEVINRGDSSSNYTLRHKIRNANDIVVKAGTVIGSKLPPMGKEQVKLEMELQDAHLWSLEDPYLYLLVTEVLVDGIVVDVYETPFGIRSIKFDANKGFFLNGKSVKLKGTNNHQDHAGVGVAIPDELQKYRLLQLKSFGCNAYRCSHNPPTPELLDLCDLLGILVIDENRLMGTTDNDLNELERLIRRDRNHPSVITWSIGNEEWAIEGNEKGARMALTMQDFAKRVDPTRPVTAAISGGRGGGILTTIEIMGSNYLIHGNTDEHHQKYPNQPFIGTEEGSTFATRGVYFEEKDKNYKPAYDLKPRPNWFTIEECWKHYSERDYLAGIFIWTGIDYRGEPTPYDWPSVISYFGMMDLCAFPKDNVYYLKSWWQTEPVLHILPHWNWPGKEGNSIDVRVYSNCEEVELFLNGKSLGKKGMEKNSHLEWKVNYQPGVVKAIGFKEGKELLIKEVKTTGKEASISLNPQKSSLKADNQDLSIITVQVLDANGNPVPTANNEIMFKMSGPAKIIGVGNGDPTSHENEKFIDNYNVIELPEVVQNKIDGEFYKKFLTGKDTAGFNKFTTKFDCNSELKGKTTIKWFCKKIADEQQVYLNDHLLVKSIDNKNENSEFLIDTKLIKSTDNQIVIIGKPLKKKNDWDNLNKQPGNIQIITPAENWRRKLFNGLAQIIVQSTGGQGEIVLKAESAGLTTGQIKINAKK